MKLLIGLSALCLAGCMSQPVVINPNWNRYSKSSFEDYHDFYFWGLSGSADVNLQKVCLEQKPYAAEFSRTTEDMALTILTAGIWAPATVKVWCGD